MKNICSILLVYITLSGCTKKSDLNNTIDAGGVYINSSASYLALGDSYTVGQGINLDQSFPYQLTKELAQPDPTIIAATGWTTANLTTAIEQSGIAGKKFEIVTLLIGVNDQYQGVSNSAYAANFANLLNSAIAFAKNPQRLIVLSIPDYSVTPFASSSDINKIAAEIDQFNATNKQITLAAGVTYLDITDISRTAKTDLNLLASDRLHPSSEMYKLWVKRLAPLVSNALNK